MTTPASAAARLKLLLVAALSALVVVAVYEIGGRVTRRPSGAPPPVDTTSPPEAEMPRDRSPLIRRESCEDLRQRYLARCPADEIAAPAPPRPAPAEGEGEADAIRESASWLDPGAHELGEMAKRCEVRFAMPAITENEPPVVTDEQSAALALSASERALVARTLRELHAELREFTERAFAAAPGGASGQTAGLTFEEKLSELETRAELGFEVARAKLARERAGIAPLPATSASQPPGEKLFRVWTKLGDEFESRLSAVVGVNRARQLRLSPHATWTNRFSQSGCINDGP